MLVAKLSILGVLLSLSIVHADVTSVIPINQTEFEKPVGHYIHIRNSLMAVVACNHYSKYDEFRKCDVSQMAIDNKSKPVSCEFVFNRYMAKVFPLTESKAVLFSVSGPNEKHKYIKYTILNFPDCETTAVEINMNSRDAVERNLREHSEAILINEDSTFDVLFFNANACDRKVCRLTLDAQGNKVKGPIAAFAPLVDISADENFMRHIKKIPSSSNFILSEATINLDTGIIHILVSLIKPEEKIVLKEFTQSIEHVNWKMVPHQVSVSHGVISFCGATENRHTVDCELFDNNGKKISNLKLRGYQWIDTVAVENLANNERLLIIQFLRIGRVMKLRSDGSIVGVARLSNIQDPDYNVLFGYGFEERIDDNENQYCVTRLGTLPSGLKFVKECFSDSDLSDEIILLLSE